MLQVHCDEMWAHAKLKQRGLRMVHTILREMTSWRFPFRVNVMPNLYSVKSFQALPKTVKWQFSFKKKVYVFAMVLVRLTVFDRQFMFKGKVCCFYFVFLVHCCGKTMCQCSLKRSPISQFGVSGDTCARRDKKKHIFFFFCHAKYTHEFALKKLCIFKICLILSRRAHVFFETPN